MSYPYYFSSYARLDDNKHTKLRDAMEELRERVRGLLGAADVAEVGFIDLDGIETGEQWVNRLGKVVANCRVLVCFCSRTYFNRPICGKEFEIFRRRLLATGAGRYVFPVIWDKCELPKALFQFNTLSGAFPKEYVEDGLCALRRLRRGEEYSQVIEALAQAIAAARRDPPLPAGAHPVDFDAAASAFDNPLSDAVSVGVLADTGLFTSIEVGRTVRSIVEDAARDVGWRQWVIDDGVADQVEAYDKRGDAAVLIVPLAPGPDWRMRLARVDRLLQSKPNLPCAVLVAVDLPAGVIGGPSPAQAEAAIQAALPNSGAQGQHGAYVATSADSLWAKLRTAFCRLRMDLVDRGDVARVEDPQLKASAQVAGVSVETRPVIGGTGGQS